MAKEIFTLKDNNTWKLQPLPPGKEVVGCKLVYKIKNNADGSIKQFKVWLVTLGNHQIEGEDFNEMFAPVTKMVMVRTLLAITVAKGWSLH